MALHKCINNFTAGELSPMLDARIDLQKYESGARRMENFRVMPWGGVTFRSGTLFIAETKDSRTASRLIPFNFNTSISYIIEMGEGYFRFYSSGERVLSAAAPTWAMGAFYPVGAFVTVGGAFYVCTVEHTGAGNFAAEASAGKWTASDDTQIVEVATPFAAAELFEVQFREINDVVYFTHSNHPPQKLSRYADTNWKMTTVQWKWPPMLDENPDDARTLNIAPTVATAVITGIYYRIIDDGSASTDWTDAGAPDSTPGTVFLCTGAATGTGTAFHLYGDGATLVANFDAFFPGHAYSYWQLRHLRDAAKVEIDLSVTTPGTTYSDTIKVMGDWTFVTTERWYGTVYVERSTDGGTTWDRLRVFTSASDRNVNASGTQATEALFRVAFVCAGDPYGTPPWSGTAPTSFVNARGTFEVAESYIAGLVLITAVIDTTHATCYIVELVERESATAIWAEGAWSGVRGWPRTLGLYEQRLFFAGTAHKPNTAWGSVVADFENFQYSDQDDAAVAYQFASAQQNPINWMMGMLRLHAGTSGGEHIVASGNLDEPLTPSNVTVRDPSSYGSEYLQALKVDNAIIFLQRQGRRIRELREMSVYANPTDFIAPDLTLLAEHLTDAGIEQMDYARTPDPSLYAVMGNGQLAVMAYNREQNINAWSRYVTDGAFESVAVVYGSPSDVAYVIVNRRIAGVTKRYVEAFTAEQPEVPFDFVYMDCAVAFDGTPRSTLTGLSHLEGATVAVVGGVDGHVIGDGALVVTNGQIVLPETDVSFARVGLAYRGQVTPVKFDQTMGNGTSQGRRRRISEIDLRFRSTRGGTWGNAVATDIARGLWNVEIPFRDTGDVMDEAPPLFTGDKVVPGECTNDLVTDISVFQSQPQPMTILGVFCKMEVSGE